jgi:transposase
MANVLKMEKQILIKQLLALGWSYRRIQNETGIRRETVSDYDPDHPRNQTEGSSKPAKVPTDPFNENQSDSTKCPPKKPTQQSLAFIHDQFIREELSKGLSAKRIFQDLVIEDDFPGSYDSVKRYVRKLKKKDPKVYARIHTAPGEEAQVDFGKAASTLKNSRWTTVWLFKMVLSYSRHSYEEAVWGQDVETFIRCHEHAFEYFGGVPTIIKLDNLKSGVLVANLYEPEINPAYAAFAKHAGFIPLPCKPRMPHHKGKVESGVGYTKNNALKGLRFYSLEAQNAHLRHWNRTWARTRIHGTTKRQVLALFNEIERRTLKPLPENAFEYFRIAIRTVHMDGHIEVDRAYYSVPHRFVGQRLTIHYNALWVKVFYKNERIAFHRKSDPGRFTTDKNHLPQEKSLSTEEYARRLLKRCNQIGPQCRLWAWQALKVRKQIALRAIQGVVRLTGKYHPDKINLACNQAFKMGAFRYHTVKLLCEEDQLTYRYGPENQLKLLQDHDLIRNLDQYGDYVESLTQNQIIQKQQE